MDVEDQQGQPQDPESNLQTNQPDQPIRDDQAIRDGQDQARAEEVEAHRERTTSSEEEATSDDDHADDDSNEE